MWSMIPTILPLVTRNLKSRSILPQTRLSRRRPARLLWPILRPYLDPGFKPTQMFFVPAIEQLEARLTPANTVSPDQVLVTQVYRDLLHREPDALGLANSTAFLAHGGSRNQLAAVIRNSPEARSVVVDGMYTAFLGRKSDPLGLSASSAFLARGGQRRADNLRFQGILSGQGRRYKSGLFKCHLPGPPQQAD
jgi:hypothetical protein